MPFQIEQAAQKCEKSGRGNQLGIQVFAKIKQ